MDNHHFRALILKLLDHISHDDRICLHFLLASNVPQRIQDDISFHGSITLIESLFDRNKINEVDLTLLINALEQIRCFSAVKLLKEHLKQNELNKSLKSLSLLMPPKINELLDDTDEEDIFVTNHDKITTNQLDSMEQRSTLRNNFEHYQMAEILSDDNYDVSQIETRQNERITSQSGINCFNRFQFILIDISKHLNKVALAMLKSLESMIEESILIIDDNLDIDFDKLPRKITVLFVSSRFAHRMKSKSKQIETIFILEDDKNKVDHRQRFGNGVDFMFQLADEIYRCYKKEANEYFELGDTMTAQLKEEFANKIHGELKKVYNSMKNESNTIMTPIDTTTTIIWLELKMQGNTEMEKLKKLLSTVVSSFSMFDKKSSCEKHLLKDKLPGIVYLIINADRQVSIRTDVKQLSNVKIIYSYEQTSSKNEINIIKYNDLCFQLLSDLAAHYNKLGSICSAQDDAKTAKAMFMKTHELYNILATL